MAKKVDISKTNSWQSKYTQTGNLGAGGNGDVILCKDKVGKTFALKQLREDQLKNREKRERFIREFNVVRTELCTLNGIIPIVDASEDGYWYVMPVAESAMNVVQKNNYSIEQRVGLVLSLAKTLSKVHEKKMAHRDIKPANILYYNEQFCFCDFGLCYIDKSNLTKQNENLGAKFTIAPEMKRYPKDADPFKADVYSMAKTLWIFLTENEKSFEGTYNPLDKENGLHHNSQFKKEYLADIELLLESATANDPCERPSMDEFCTKLEDWSKAHNNKLLAEQKEWEMLKHYLNPVFEIDSMTITNIDSIIHILNCITLTPALNHLFYPQGGGLDFEWAEKAVENGCIAIHTGPVFWEIIKPKRLIYESMGNVKWSYFILEIEKMKPIFSAEQNLIAEDLVEDTPGHYCDSTDAVYGVYDYDSGILLPKNWRHVERFCRGKLLIVPKLGYYNRISSAYDGRHSNCTVSQFKAYIERLQKLVGCAIQEGYDDRKCEDILNNAPNPPFSQSNNMDFSCDNTTHSYAPEGFFDSKLDQLDFSNDLAKLENTVSPVEFCFYIDGKVKTILNSLSFRLFEPKERLYLCNNGKFYKKKKTDAVVVKVQDRNVANVLCEGIDSEIAKLYADAGYYYNKSFHAHCNIEIQRIGKPSHLFTKKEIEDAMIKADDRLGNTLVIDENGFAKVLPGYINKRTYPVSQETWDGRNNYVGKYSSLSDLDLSYLWMLEGWLRYLKTNKACYISEATKAVSEKELLAEIKRFLL